MCPGKLKALIFDLDDTLVVEKASAEAAFLRTCELARQRHGIDPEALHATLRRICRSIWHNAPARDYCVEIGISSWEGLWARFHGREESLQILRAWAPRYRRDSWLCALREHGVDDEAFAAELAETFPAHRRELHVVYDDVRATLEYFGLSHRLGLLTNGAPDLQREKIEGAGLARYFDDIVISGDVGVGKPNPRIYEIMLSRLKAKPHETVMIGNSLTSDVAGPQAVGIKAVWLNRAGDVCRDGVVPDLEVPNLSELRRAVDESRRGESTDYELDGGRP
ncbi:MAG: HAD family hydrolase [Sedimentisphaerales bacterium]|nr:HAD family hydrolase [Sedimentisphaerales bacterium]